MAECKQALDGGNPVYPYTRKRRDEKSRSVGELDDVYKLKEAEEVTKPKTPSLQEIVGLDNTIRRHQNDVTETDDDVVEIDEEEFLSGNPFSSQRATKKMDGGESQICNSDTFLLDNDLVIFAPFKRLPAEIQIKIWKASLPESRIVQLRMMAISQSLIRPAIAPGSSRKKSQRYCITTDITLSPLLHTCKLSRQIMLETYKIHIPSKGSRKFHVDDEADWVIMGDPFLAGGSMGSSWDVDKCRLYENALRGVKRLVFPGKFLLGGGSLSKFGHWLLSLFCSLDTLIIFSKSISAPKKTWKNDNLCLLTDKEFWDELGVGASDFVLDDIEEKDEVLEVLREELEKIGGKCPVVTHMWLCRKYKVVKVVKEVRADGDRRRVRMMYA